MSNRQISLVTTGWKISWSMVQSAIPMLIYILWFQQYNNKWQLEVDKIPKHPSTSSGYWFLSRLNRIFYHDLIKSGLIKEILSFKSNCDLNQSQK